MTTSRRTIGSRRIPLHDHNDLNSGGKLRISQAIHGGLETIQSVVPPSSHHTLEDHDAIGLATDAELAAHEADTDLHGGAVVFLDEGVSIGTATAVNVTGAGGTASYSGGTVTINVAGTAALSSVIVQDEGATIGTATTINVVGAGGTASFAGGTATVTITSGGSGQGLVDYAFARRTSGDITCSADQIWADADTGMDLVLAAASGDTVRVCLSGACTGTEASTLNLDAVTVVSAAPVNSIATGAAPDNANSGVSGWRSTSGVISHFGTCVMYTLQAGDISGGTVTIRLRYRTSTNTNRVLRAEATLPLFFSAENLGAAL